MFFKKKSNVIFRNYETFGYITDNRNFSYMLLDDENCIGDKILSESGAVFFSALESNPKDIDYLTNKVRKIFKDVDGEIIKNDLDEFYNMLEQEGFIVSGKTILECEKKDTKFSYRMVEVESRKKDNVTLGNRADTQEFFDEYYSGNPQLTNLHIEITSRCNERCIHCYIPNNNKLTDIDAELFYNILDQCKSMNLLHLTLSGGEPMLHSSFCGFLKKCNELNFSVNVLTNLTLLNDDIINEIKSNPLISIQVSLYSMNPDIHDEITQVKGSFEKTKKGILELIKSNVPLQISCPIMKLNKNCYADVKCWASQYKIRVNSDFVIIGRYDSTTDNLYNRLSIFEVKDFININYMNDSNYIDNLIKEVDKKSDIGANDFVCSVGQSSICVSENGNVYPCAGWQNYIIGNVNEVTLENIWNNSEKLRCLRDLRRKEFPKCLQCEDREFCTMCMVRNANEDTSGNHLMVNEYYCNIARLNRELVMESIDEKNI